MPGFFDNLRNWVAMRAPYTSTAGHRNAQRTNAVTQIAGQGLESLNSTAVIPTKFAQFLTSGYALFRHDTHVSEKLIHTIQLLLAGAHTGLAIALLFQEGDCDELTSNVCKAVTLCEFLYQGTLIVGWVPSELSKDPPPAPAPV
ncbi:hypothetical protein [Legionella feeleii]|uniref:Uncharacterized protein n=1 Tax=Legionella feeleii TaxID=453 RepID=A0A0W0TKQ5_9GAMM|nr:hypothetical protein [Legionella feeleii]KTC96190.1 hypothetical protein Lfee_1988 [Legionella feeleii]SPX61429.1 Uncharacterised protein [Legionella feeleii]